MRPPLLRRLAQHRQRGPHAGVDMRLELREIVDEHADQLLRLTRRKAAIVLPGQPRRAIVGKAAQPAAEITVGEANIVPRANPAPVFAPIVADDAHGAIVLAIGDPVVVAAMLGLGGLMAALFDAGDLVIGLAVALPVLRLALGLCAPLPAVLAHPRPGLVTAAVGLAQNLAAIRALATEGIQRGHMGLHARQIAIAAGAEGDEIAAVAAQLVQEKNVRGERAGEVLAELRGKS